MTAFYSVLLKLAPAFIYVIVGFLLRKIFRLKIKWVANALFYILVPLMVFKGALCSNPKPFILLIILAFLICVLLVFCAQLFQNRFRSVLAPGVLKCAFAYFNIGWFGIPIAQALYGNQGANIMAALYIGGMLFGNTLAYLLISQSNTNNKKSLTKLLTIPALYSVVIAFALHSLSIRSIIISNALFQVAFHYIAIATSLFGMGLVGMGIANTKFKNISYGALLRLLLYRLLTASIIVSILTFVFYETNLINGEQMKVVLLIPMLPIAAAILIFTTKNNVENDFISAALLSSTLLSFLLLLIVFTLF